MKTSAKAVFGMLEVADAISGRLCDVLALRCENSAQRPALLTTYQLLGQRGLCERGRTGQSGEVNPGFFFSVRSAASSSSCRTGSTDSGSWKAACRKTLSLG